MKELSVRSVTQLALGSKAGLWALQRLARRYPSRRWVQRLCWHAGRGVQDTRMIRRVITSKGFTLNLDLSDHTRREIFFFGDYEREVTAILSRLAAPGQVWWDVGANLGWFTMLLSRLVGSAGKVIAFEPNPATAVLLKRSLSEERIYNVLLRELALGEKSESATLHIPIDPENTDGGHGRPSLIRQTDIAECEELNVSISSIDDQIEMGVPLPFGIKMDVEGFESAVLAGAARFFTQTPPAVIICEATHRPDVLMRPTELVQQIRGLGYTVFHAETLQEYDSAEPIDGSWSKDFVFLHTPQISGLIQKLQAKETGTIGQ